MELPPLPPLPNKEGLGQFIMKDGARKSSH